jgi:hypothetical protein
MLGKAAGSHPREREGEGEVLVQVGGVEIREKTAGQESDLFDLHSFLS